MASEAGKGSKPRKITKESIDAFEEGHDRIFRKKRKELREGIHYETDTDNLNDIKYDIHIPNDHYSE